MLDYFRSTKFKIRVANLLYQMLRLVGVSPVRIIERKGIRYQVDLAEGIDLSLFLFGHYQKHVTHVIICSVYHRTVWYWMLVPTLGSSVYL